MFRKFRFWLARKILPVLGEVSEETKFKGLTFKEILNSTKWGEPIEVEAISPYEIKPYFELENGETICFPQIQAFSVSWHPTQTNNCSLVQLLLEEDILASLPSPVKHIEFQACNERGVLSILKLRDVTLGYSEYSASVEDIVSEVITHFDVGSVVPWTKVENETLPS